VTKRISASWENASSAIFCLWPWGRRWNLGWCVNRRKTIYSICYKDKHLYKILS